MSSKTTNFEAGSGRRTGALRTVGITMLTAAGALYGAENAAPPFAITEYRITGATRLTELEKGRAIYPYLGPVRTAADIEAARAALEKAYRDKGLETVAVEAPYPLPRGGVVHLRVTETTVGQLNVHGARYFLPSQVAAQAPSLAPGAVPDFAHVQRDLLALNQWPDRKVTPVLRQGLEPGTVDVDLNVEDKLPLHGSLELNNRYSAGTSPLRLDGSLSYSNLWQRGHTFGASFQIAPQELEEVKVFSAYYIARFPQWPGFSLLLQGTKQDSNVSTLGGAAVAGRGESAGVRAIFTLPGGAGFSQTASFGVDYKHYQQTLNLGLSSVATPIDYWPVTAGYSASWVTPKSHTEFDASATWAFRGTGSAEAEFDANRFRARGSFFYLRGDLAHTQELPAGAQAYGKVQGQASSQPLISNEQFTGGGLGTVRGYLEAAALGDDGFFGTAELRTPSLLGWTKRKDTEWRVYGFFDGGVLTLQQPLAEQQARAELASVGFGTRVQVFEYLRGSLDVGFPLTAVGQARVGEPQLTFRVWSEF